jgi:hypothetical protein
MPRLSESTRHATPSCHPDRRRVVPSAPMRPPAISLSGVAVEPIGVLPVPDSPSGPASPPRGSRPVNRPIGAVMSVSVRDGWRRGRPALISLNAGPAAQQDPLYEGRRRRTRAVWPVGDSPPGGVVISGSGIPTEWGDSVAVWPGCPEPVTSLCHLRNRLAP